MQWWFGILIVSISQSGVRRRCAAAGRRLDTAFPLRASERQRFHRRDEPIFAARAA
ncbi:MAG TPA: hypothetical protein VMU69_13050 [Bradyrhizobium sp.]|nr:hypothetical protein [Bradyrhizobium sp.]